MPAIQLSDPDRPPPATELVETLGALAPGVRDLDAWIHRTYGLDAAPVYDSRDTGWTIRYRRGGKTLVTLVPRDGTVRALVVVGPSAWAAVADAPLSAGTRAAWAAARPYPDGRWLRLDVRDSRSVTDVERLIALKSPPPKRVRIRVAGARETAAT